MDKMRMESSDMAAQNIEKIGALFPNCITETVDENGKPKKVINFDLLKQMLSGDVIEGNEAYEFTWVGKKAAIVEANTPIRKTLRPCKEDSVNWDTTENLYIEGDNLEVLKLLQESYLGAVKMIYIDPPYNTGNDFIYRDDFKQSADEYEDGLGIYDDVGNRIFKNTDSNGRFHSDWCSMMYPRLLLARNFLADDGVIFISIGDKEQANLNKICDEIFGDANFIGNIARVAKKGGNKGDIIKPKKDMILVYAKSILDLRQTKVGVLVKDEEKTWLTEDYKGLPREYILGEVPYRAKLDARPNQRYYIECPDGSLIIPKGEVFPMEKRDAAMIKPASNFDKCWTWSVDRYLKEKENHRFYFYKTPNSPYLDQNGNQSAWGIRKKIFKEELTDENYDVLSDFLDAFNNAMGTAEVDELEIPFSYPKPSALVKYLIERVTTKDSVIMDFFSGSSTTAHAVLNLNKEDGGRRKYIMVQLPEKVDEKSEAFIQGYRDICEIGKERIRRAGNKIKKDSSLTIEEMDFGFRVFKLDDSNMTDVYYSANEYSQDLLSMLESNVKADRTDLDLLFGCLLEWGLPLSLPYTSETIEGCTVHTYNDGDLIACFDENIPDSVIKTIARRRPLRAVFRDRSFASSPSKINVGEVFKLLAPKTRVKVI